MGITKTSDILKDEGGAIALRHGVTNSLGQKVHVIPREAKVVGILELVPTVLEAGPLQTPQLRSKVAKPSETQRTTGL